MSFIILERGRTVREPEEHDRGSKRPQLSERCLPFVSFFDPNVVVSPANVKLSEILAWLQRPC